MNGFQSGIAGKFLTPVGGNRWEGSLWILAGHDADGHLHRVGGSIRHLQGVILPCFLLNEGGDACFAFAPVGNDGIQFPVTKGRTLANLFRPFADWSSNEKAASGFDRFTALALLPQDLNLSDS